MERIDWLVAELGSVVTQLRSAEPAKQCNLEFAIERHHQQRAIVHLGSPGRVLRSARDDLRYPRANDVVELGLIIGGHGATIQISHGLGASRTQSIVSNCGSVFDRSIIDSAEGKPEIVLPVKDR